jgi:hypothetical protein
LGGWSFFNGLPHPQVGEKQASSLESMEAPKKPKWLLLIKTGISPVTNKIHNSPTFPPSPHFQFSPTFAVLVSRIEVVMRLVPGTQCE